MIDAKSTSIAMRRGASTPSRASACCQLSSPACKSSSVDPDTMTVEEIQVLLDNLDLRLANGEISEATYQQLYARWQNRLT